MREIVKKNPEPGKDSGLYSKSGVAGGPFLQLQSLPDEGEAGEKLEINCIFCFW